MKYINNLFFGSFLILLFFNNAFSQEKSGEENSHKQKDMAKNTTKKPEEIWGFKLSVFSCTRQQGEYKNHSPIITDLKLDKTELSVEELMDDSEGSLSINVFTDVSDADGDVLVYKYEVSGGKIIGQREKVIWDLSGIKTGAYTIKVLVDDGCNFCGNTITKTVIIK